MLKTAKVAFAVGVGDFKACGCPFCGSKNGTAHGFGGDAILWSCHCGQPFVVLAAGVARSPIRLFVDERWVTPELRAHPRRFPTGVFDADGLGLGIIKADELPATDMSDR